jgi:hypothetical protein
MRLGNPQVHAVRPLCSDTIPHQRENVAGLLAHACLEKRTHPIDKCGPMSTGAEGDAAWPFPARRIASDCNFQAGKRRKFLRRN